MEKGWQLTQSVDGLGNNHIGLSLQSNNRTSHTRISSQCCRHQNICLLLSSLVGILFGLLELDVLTLPCLGCLSLPLLPRILGRFCRVVAVDGEVWKCGKKFMTDPKSSKKLTVVIIRRQLVSPEQRQLKNTGIVQSVKPFSPYLDRDFVAGLQQSNGRPDLEEFVAAKRTN